VLLVVVGGAAGDDDVPGGEGCGPLELVAGEEDGGAVGRGVPDEAVEEVASGGVEPGVGLVEEPEPDVPAEEDGERAAAALAGGEAADGDVADALLDAGPVHGVVGVDVRAGGAGPEADVLLDGEVLVEAVVVAEEGDVGADPAAVLAEVVAEDDGVAPHDRHQPGDRSEHRRLAGAVRPSEEHDLPGGDVEVDAGQCGEPPQEADRGAEVDGGVHGDLRKTVPAPLKALQDALRSRAVGVRRVVGAVGRVLVAIGTLLLLFVAYQLWGTGIHEARAQGDLRDEFERSITTTSTSSTTSTTALPGEPTTTTTAEVPPPPPEGRALAVLRIPKLGLDKTVIEGVGVPDLKKAPGHYPGTPLPGQPGNSAIAGHRTTYGAPFYRLNELNPGDRIFVTTKQGQFRFLVEEVKIVKPTQVEVLRQTEDARLTLTTCHPRYSARQRLIVTAVLAPNVDPAPTTTTSTSSTTTTTLPEDVEPSSTIAPTTTEPPRLLFEEQSLSGDRAAAGPTVLWGVIAALVAAVVWFISRKWRKWPAYLLGAPFFLIALFLFYENVARLLPANI
jgi:sortase A